MSLRSNMSSGKIFYNKINDDPFPDSMTIILGKEQLKYKKQTWNIGGEIKGLRYGENPDQPAALFKLQEGSLDFGGIKWISSDNALVSAISEKNILQSGKHPGKTNLTDLDNGINILQYLYERPAAIILKHNNPCGASWVANKEGGIEKALLNAFWADRIAAFGGAVVLNRPLTVKCAELIAANYFEVIAAPEYEENALSLLKTKKNLRIIELPGLGDLRNLLDYNFLDIKSLADGGIIVQKSFKNRINSIDDFYPAMSKTKDGIEVCARAPDNEELADLKFAWAVEAGVSSNSVIFAKNGTTVAIGTGEQDRVGCVELAIHKAYTKKADEISYKEYGLTWYELKQKAKNFSDYIDIKINVENRVRNINAGLKGSCLVSDGFFPFRDGIDVAIGEGVTAIAQPGGSIRDAESISACNEAVPQVAMVFTGQRSFRH